MAMYVLEWESDSIVRKWMIKKTSIVELHAA